MFKSHPNLRWDGDEAYCMTACQTSGSIGLTEIHKRDKQAEKPFICVSDYTVKLRVGVIFLIPEMMHRAVNKSSGTMLKTKPDGRKQFTKEHILHENWDVVGVSFPN